MAGFLDTRGEQAAGDVLLTTDASGQLGAVLMWDLGSGYSLNAYKGEAPAPRTLALLTNDFFVYAARSRAALFVHSVCKKDQVHMRMDVPGLVSALAATPCGDCVVAAVGKHIYLWQVWSGNLVAQVTDLLGDITCLRFSRCGSHFVSGDDLGQVIAWSKTRLVEDCLYQRQASHKWKASRHAGQITDMHVGLGSDRGTVVSSSLDRTCRIWDMVDGSMLYCLTFDAAIHSVTMDLRELLLFAGDRLGRIFRIKTSTLQSQEVHIHTDSTECTVFADHQSQVLFLALSCEGALVSGSADKLVLIRKQSAGSASSLTRLEHKGEITNLIIPDIPLNCNESNPRLVRPPPFKRQLYTLDEPCHLKMALGSTDPTLPSRTDLSPLGLNRKQSEKEEQHLRKEVEGLREANKELYRFIQEELSK